MLGCGSGSSAAQSVPSGFVESVRLVRANYRMQPADTGLDGSGQLPCLNMGVSEK